MRNPRSIGSERWDCGEIPPLSVVEEDLREFIDTNVYEALVEYGADISIQFCNGSDIDAVFLYVSEGRIDNDGEPAEDIGTSASLREAVEEALTCHDDDELLKLALHFEELAKLIRKSVTVGA